MSSPSGKVRIAVLMTSFNRRVLTLAALHSLYSQETLDGFSLTVFLLDDGSRDGTRETVKAEFPNVRLLFGTGSLYWSGGMRVAFAAAMEEGFDYYLWFNDDVTLQPDALQRLLQSATLIEKSVGPAIVVGSVQSPITLERSYGGVRRHGHGLRLDFPPVFPDPSRFLPCDTMNGNFTLISARVADSVGNLDSRFQHQLADFDYGLRATAAGVPIFVAPGLYGTCSDNPGANTWRDRSIPLTLRWKHLMSPKGAPPREWLLYTFRHFGWRWPLYFVSPYWKALFGEFETQFQRAARFLSLSEGYVPPSLPSTDTSPGKQKLANKGRMIQLDFARGIAIAMVLSFHYGIQSPQSYFGKSLQTFLEHVGWMGVDLFFVLSGFLIGGLLFKELLQTGDLRIRRFLIRRAFKIWPAYYFYILFQVLLRRHPLGSFLWQNLLNIQNYAGTSLNHTWSLAVEEQFYLLVPFVLAAIYKRPSWKPYMAFILLATCGVVLAGRVAAVYRFGNLALRWKTHARLDSLMFGVTLSCLSSMHAGIFRRILEMRSMLMAACAAGLVFALLHSASDPVMLSIGYTINYLWLASLLLLVYGYRGSLTQSLPYRFVAWVGIYSYGIYLWHISVHEPIISVGAHLPIVMRAAAILVTEWLAALTLGVITTKLLEFPMLRLRERLVA